MSEQLWQVFGSNFTAGIVTRDDRVVDAAPILRRQCMGRTREEVRAVAKRCGWTIRSVGQAMS